MSPLLRSQRRPISSGGGGAARKALIKLTLLALGVGGIVLMQSFASRLGGHAHAWTRLRSQPRALNRSDSSCALFVRPAGMRRGRTDAIGRTDLRRRRGCLSAVRRPSAPRHRSLRCQTPKERDAPSGTAQDKMLTTLLPRPTPRFPTSQP